MTRNQKKEAEKFYEEEEISYGGFGRILLSIRFLFSILLCHLKTDKNFFKKT